MSQFAIFIGTNQESFFPLQENFVQLCDLSTDWQKQDQRKETGLCNIDENMQIFQLLQWYLRLHFPLKVLIGCV